MKASRPTLVLLGIVCLVLAAVLLAAMHDWEYLRPMPLPLAYKAGVGRSYCQAIAETAQDRSSQWLFVGAVVLLAGVIATGCGAMIGPGASGDQSVRGKLRENRNALLALAGALALSLGYGLIQRSDAATALAAGASANLALDDDLVAYKTCIMQRANWLMGRADHAWLDNLPGAQRLAVPSSSAAAPAAPQ